MSDINKVMLIGRLTRDCEFKQLTNTTVTNFSLAINRKIRGSDGNWNDEVSYFDVELYGKLGEAIKGYLTRGKQIAVEGALRQQRWEANDGQKRSRVVIVASNVQLLGGSSGGSGGNSGSENNYSGNNNYQQNQSNSYQQATSAPQEQSSSNLGNSSDFSDDVPF